MIKRLSANCSPKGLEEDCLANIHVIGRMKDVKPSWFYTFEDDEDSFIFEHDNWVMPYAKTPHSLSRLLDAFDFKNETEFASVPKHTADAIISHLDDYEVAWEELCLMMYLPESHWPQYEKKTSFLSALTEDDLETVNTYYTYKDDDSLNYLRDCILKNPSSVLRDPLGAPISWALLREDGSLGVMYTLKEYRKKGYALEVAEDLIAKTLKSGYVPYVHIRVENVASIALAKHLGLVSWGEVLWFALTKKHEMVK